MPPCGKDDAMQDTIEQLRQFRIAQGWSRRKCAAQIGDITERALRSYEEGTRNPPPLVLRVVTQFLKRKGITN